MKSAQERFWAKVEKQDSGCWLWTGSGTQDGYGLLRVDGRKVLAHRFAYQLLVGPIPDGLELDHLCRVRNCVNPNDLEPVRHRENCRRGEAGAFNRLKTHCIRGHPFDLFNTYVRANGRRGCRFCDRARKADSSYA